VRTDATRVLSALLVIIGVAMLVRTLSAGGGPLSIGVLAGLAFCGIGAGRLYLQLRG
jgi:hypothetical protein